MSSSYRWIDPSILHNHFHNCGRNMLHLIYIPNAYNLYQANEMPSGWPLGLENMNMRFRVMERLQAASEDPNSTSISSFTSSDLDTEVILFRPLLLFFNHYYSKNTKRVTKHFIESAVHQILLPRSQHHVGPTDWDKPCRGRLVLHQLGPPPPRRTWPGIDDECQVASIKTTQNERASRHMFTFDIVCSCKDQQE